jgi:hypothetical protein
MSVFLERAAEIWTGLACPERSQFHAGDEAVDFTLCRDQALSRNDITPL